MDLLVVGGSDAGISAALPARTVDPGVEVTVVVADRYPDYSICVHTHHRLLADPTYLPLGTTAHKQGRVAGENALGGHRTYAGSLGSQVVKVFDRVIARTGLDDASARALAFVGPDHLGRGGRGGSSC